jgi:glutamate synthase domain-containing protein 2
MLIALHAILGVDLIVIVAFAVFVSGAGGGSNASPANSRERSGCPAATSRA